MVGWQDPQGSGALATKAQTSDSSQEPQRNVSKSHGNFCLCIVGDMQSFNC